MGAYEVQPIPQPPDFLGDYNNDGTVDAADYTVWRDTLGQVVLPYSGADGDGSGIVDAGDYAVWKANFGNTLAAAAVAALEDIAPTPQGGTVERSSAMSSAAIDAGFAHLGLESKDQETASQTSTRIAASESMAVPDDELLLLLQGQTGDFDDEDASREYDAFDEVFASEATHFDLNEPLLALNGDAQ